MTAALETLAGRTVAIIRLDSPMEAAEFRQVIGDFATLPPGSEYVFDLSMQYRIHARGLSRLTLLCKLSHECSIRLHMVGLHPHLQALIELIRLDRLFKVHDDLAACRHWLLEHGGSANQPDYGSARSRQTP